MQKAERIPAWLQVYFWDVSLEELDTRQHQAFIIKRLLNEGDHRSLAWLLKHFS